MNQQLLDEILALKQHDVDTWSRLISEGRLYGDYVPEMQQVHRENAIELDEIISKHGCWPGFRSLALNVAGLLGS